jgi:hypothetical protein
MERTEQWYNHIASLPMDILKFEQGEEESIGATWARFLRLLASDLDLLSLIEDVSLYIFCMNLDMDAALELDDNVEGSSVHKTPAEVREILESLMVSSFFPINPREPFQSESSHVDLLAAESDASPSTSSYLAIEHSPELGKMEEEEIQPPEFLCRFKDDPFENLRNT